MSGLDGFSIGLGFAHNKALRDAMSSTYRKLPEETEQISVGFVREIVGTIAGIPTGLVRVLQVCAKKRLSDSAFKPLACYIAASATAFGDDLVIAGDKFRTGDMRYIGEASAKIFSSAVQMTFLSNGIAAPFLEFPAQSTPDSEARKKFWSDLEVAIERP